MFTASRSPGGSGRARAARVAAQLERLYPRLVEFAAQAKSLPPGAEWMLDNHFVIRRSVREVRTGLVPGFERRLPRSGRGDGPSGGRAGARRIEDQARTTLAEADGLLDRAALIRRTERFGVERGASLAELWALPLYLRLLLLEQLAADAPALMLDQPLDIGVDQRIANCVRSLLLIEKTDWARFFEQVSEVHAISSRDPAGVYPGMDFETRDRYRQAVEELARRLDLPEPSLAARAIEAAADASEDDDVDPLHRHVGYYLLDDGRAALGVAHDALAQRRRRTIAYVGGIVALAALLLTGLVWLLIERGAGPGVIVVAALLAVIPAWTVSATAIDKVVGLLVSPRPLAKLAFRSDRSAVPDSCRTLLVVPGLLVHPRDADALLVRIEEHYLATRDPNIELALLTDFGDADQPERPDDADLLERARRGVAILNERHGAGEQGPFHLFHRRRVWSERQGRWMGWERKRGKLEELNRLLRGDTETTYVVHEGREGHFEGFRYVITLDADTILPIGAARRMIETLAHPLNVARFDAQGRTVAGYTVLQPRVDIAPEPGASRFARIYGGDGAFDIYTRAASDVYQDLFGEGVFVGKGIYDLDAFRASLEGQLPCDRILSHDLLEGVHGRAGLVSDVVVYEDYPNNYVAYVRRLHRWIRGDWQLLPWLGRWVPTACEPRRNRLSSISRWKILDNLRRSALLPSLVAFAVFAWFLLPGPAWSWTVLVVLVMAAPMLADLSSKIVRARGKSLRPALSDFVGSVPRAAARWAMGSVVMVHEAAVSVDAIARALIRTKLTRRRQLEWTPAAMAGRGTTSQATILRSLGPALGFALALALALLLLRPAAVPGAAPLLLAWVLAPALVAWTARPPRADRLGEPGPVELDQARMRRLARRTWAFFERTIGPEDHWLPPDHLQEHPKGEVAHRTSPTNIAMGMLSTVSAYELGYFDLLELVVRLRNMIENLGQLPRHNGHFFNWCDTTTLRPLEPRYVSTVDSGNLAIALLLVEQSCRELSEVARPFDRRCDGLCDTLDVFVEELESWGPAADPARRQLAAMRARLEGVRGPADWLRALDGLEDSAFVALDRALLDLFEAEQGGHDPIAFEHLRGWAAQLRRDVGSLRNELGVQLPWLPLATTTPGPVPSALTPTLAALRVELGQLPMLGEVAAVGERALAQVEAARALEGLPTDWQRWLEQLGEGVQVSLDHAVALRERLLELAERAASLLASMDFRFLYDRERELMYIGYDATAERYDEHHYDLLASEARIASLVAIAKGEAPLRHWAKLGRPIGRFGAGRGLLSWSGTMFEYLMPPLVLDEGEGTLLDVSVRAAVRAQIEFGRRRRVPWGVSESGYARLDIHRNYQYRAFGVAEIGFRRELERDVVIAPYASLLALRYAPAEVEVNLDHIVKLGGLGPLGVYEALDFTRARLELGQSHAVVRSYMAHHQGMIMLALHGELRERRMVARAHRHPLIRAVELLLRERPPGRVPLERPQPAEGGPLVRARVERVRSWPALREQVQAHVIGNGRYSVLISSDGAGYSYWRKLAITRPSFDPVLADDGFAIALRERESGQRWSFRARPDDELTREVEFSAHGARFLVHSGELVAELEVCVALDVDAELRVVRVTERAGRARRLTITGFAELALADPGAHARHPAFARLFVSSQLSVEPRMIICRRRPREPGEAALWFGCALVSDVVEWTGYELDRAACLGRTRGGIEADGELQLRPLPSTSTPMHAAIDTCVALGGELELRPDETCECAFVLLAARSRAELLEKAELLLNMAQVRRLVLEAERGARARAEELGKSTELLTRQQRLLSAIVYPRARMRAALELAERERLGQPGLWRYGISGDWPLLLVHVSTVGMSALGELIRAHRYWRARGFPVDLIVVEEQALGYGGDVRQRLMQVLERERAAIDAVDGGVFLVHAPGLDERERELLYGSAALVIDASVEDFAARLELPRHAPLPLFVAEGQVVRPTPKLERPDDLLLDNGYGGFSPDGSEYVIQLEPGRSTPAPWINVLANPRFGCVVSERGSGYTWSQNAGLNRLSAWSNDPVLDPPSESLYLRDELDGELWSPVPAPAPTRDPSEGAYQVRHGIGRTCFVHHSHGLRQRVELFVDPEWPVKFIRVRLEDCWERRRRLTLTLCVEWLLGAQRPADTRLLTTDFEPKYEVALAHNPWNPSFADRWAFAAASAGLHGMTGSREEFFGRGGSRARPAALQRIGLAGELAHGEDACAALQVHVDLEPGGATELHFVIGEADDREAAIALAERCRARQVLDDRGQALDELWEALLGAVEVATPDPAFDLMCNRWLLYQSVASRLWGRTGFFQSSGGFGFRDQLQDVLALVHAAPELIREHLLDAARRQYEPGDVQHWWHPPTGQGLRSRCSDDLLWMPLAAAAYVRATGDAAVLEERVPFLDSPPLRPEEIERYESEPRWGRDGTLYEHCMQALVRGKTSGAHGLPLIGSCDWNDGFSRVGIEGRGESVWLGWFYAVVAKDFAAVCERIGEHEDAQMLRSAVASLVEPVERSWDGAWYRRAYDDDGVPLGSAGSRACKIDSLTQSWAVISRLGDPERAREAMASAWEWLVVPEHKLVRLFTPAFDSQRPTLGYIEAYPPGVRENGGQYTHAAVWVAWAFAALGEHDRAYRLWSMLVPTAHTRELAAVDRYRVEPYVIAADVYAEPPHVGRGGWTWYTGAAGWTYRLAIEQILGLDRIDGRVTLDPIGMPSSWPSFELRVREGEIIHHVRVERLGPGEVFEGVRVDGALRQPPIVLSEVSRGPERTIVIQLPGARVDARAPRAELVRPEVR
ncbi:MAG: glucoamylase family protein [Enhygromyxa sp.]